MSILYTLTLFVLSCD